MALGQSSADLHRYVVSRILVVIRLYWRCLLRLVFDLDQMMEVDNSRAKRAVSKYWVVYPDDLVFNPMWAIEGGVAVSEVEGAASTAYRIYDFKPFTVSPAMCITTFEVIRHWPSTG